MMHIKNERGFSHHFLLPLFVMLIVGAIGAAVMTKSQAVVYDDVVVKYTKVVSPVSVPKHQECNTGYLKNGTLCYPTKSVNPCSSGHKVASVDSKGYTVIVTCQYTKRVIAKPGTSKSQTGKDNSSSAKSNYGQSRATIAHKTNLARKMQCTKSGTISKGSKGACVKYLQQVMQNLKIKDQNGKALAVDGDFGVRTDYVVRKFQKSQKLTVDGKVGAKTWGKVDAAANAKKM